ncbi:unnamed protein product [Thlaspi arvense]|uniref:F-box domain-containing protein n=1 Tax=Thlaspi arvense TaxID=13288 RepID=A0AAU9SUN2_THLAR|nr:unnamed protein product [Thlaspi arvense]
MASSSPTLPTVPHRRPKTQRRKALIPSFADLPLCLVEVIMSQLVLKDNIRASAACKSWREAAVSVRVVEKHPWLLYIPKRGHQFKLCDPLPWKSYTIDLPELAKSTVCYSRDGWLLMHRSSSSEIFFFNPFSRELLSLPKLDLSFQDIAFSCPPTSDDCVVLALNFYVINLVTISTCHPGGTDWIRDDFPTDYRPFTYTNCKLLYLNDRFYCLSARGGWLYSFRLSSRKWKLHQRRRNQYETAAFLAERKGKLFLMYSRGNEKPKFYKLVYLAWKEMTSTELDGLTFFASFHNSELRSDLPWMRNNVFFSRFGYNRKRLSYSFDENSWYNRPKEWRNCWNRHPTAYIYPYRWWTECTRAIFMAEMKRELFLVFTRNEKPIVYKLVYLRWREVTGTELDGMTIFVSFHNSELRSELPWMRNNVFFSRFGNNCKRCVSYSFDENRYSPPKKSEEWSELCPPQSLWINPPKNMLEYL